MEYPEHEKLKARKAEHQAISEFIEFIEGQGNEIIHYVDVDSDDPYNKPIIKRSSNSDMIAEFFGIDQQKFSEEKDQMIKSLTT
jgi:hypothetical protein